VLSPQYPLFAITPKRASIIGGPFRSDICSRCSQNGSPHCARREGSSAGRTGQRFQGVGEAPIPDGVPGCTEQMVEANDRIVAGPKEEGEQFVWDLAEICSGKRE
jgi:hypothetical protein